MVRNLKYNSPQIKAIIDKMKKAKNLLHVFNNLQNFVEEQKQLAQINE